MIAWYWILIAFVIGELCGIGAVAICSGGEYKNNKYIK